MDSANEWARCIDDYDGFGVASLIEAAPEMHPGLDDERIEVIRIQWAGSRL